MAPSLAAPREPKQLLPQEADEAVARNRFCAVGGLVGSKIPHLALPFEAIPGQAS